jgi:hypothetical protein
VAHVFVIDAVPPRRLPSPPVATGFVTQSGLAQNQNGLTSRRDAYQRADLARRLVFLSPAELGQLNCQDRLDRPYQKPSMTLRFARSPLS